MKAARRYLFLPVKRGAPKRELRLCGYTAEVELAQGEPDFFAHIDIDRLRGTELGLEGTGAFQGDELPQGVYDGPLRPQIHFSSMRGWNNDPNGLVRLDGEWHLFYQHNPFGTAWGNMHWGHAVSTDLVRWRELGDALAPDGRGAMYSGSGVVDAGNTSGLGAAGDPPMVLLYTAAGGRTVESRGEPFTQALAWSRDRGRSWSKLGPMVPHIAAENRDPKVLWHGPTRQWVMALYLDGDEYALLASPDLRRWRLLQRLRLEGARECPDLFEVGDRWVFWGANGRYLLGDFDGSRFEPSSGPHTFSYGTAYAAQTWSGAPRDRVVQIAWLKGDKPGEPFNQQMTLPCSLSLRDTAEGPRLASEPVPELSSLAAGRGRLEAGRIEAGAPPARLRAGELLDVTLEARLEGDAALEIHLRGLTVECCGGEMACCGHRGPLALEGQTLRLRAVVDRSSLELFAGGGLSNMPLPLVPETGNREVSLRVTRGCLAGVRLRVVTLRSAWP